MRPFSPRLPAAVRVAFGREAADTRRDEAGRLMTRDVPTLIGHVDSVKGGVITIRLRDVPTFMLVDGHSYRIGQVGAFLRIPLGYTQLYAVCTLVGAAAVPKSDESGIPAGHHWLAATFDRRQLLLPVGDNYSCRS